MVTEKETLRLSQIRSSEKFFATECDCCGKFFVFEEMWTCDRYCPAINRTVEFNYCKDCMPTKRAVLNEIDTDEWPYGLAFVDDCVFFQKKDYSRMRAVKIPPFPEIVKVEK